MRTKAIFIASTICALAVATAIPVTAADNTPVTVTLTGGALSITVPTSSVNLGSRVNTVTEGTISGSLGEVQVLDARSAVAGSGWVASVISTALTPPVGPTIGAASIGYTVGAITKVGTATYTANNPVALDGNVAAVTATGITGDNSATWNPTINVTVAGGMAASTYSGTITHSVV